VTHALILDCDGVIADTERDGHLVAFNRAFEEFGLPFRWSVDEYGELLKIGGGKERMRAYLARHAEYAVGAGDLDQLIARLHERKSANYVELVDAGLLPARPGIARLVGEALDAGWLVACASTSAPRSVESVLGAAVGARTRARMAGVFAGDIVQAKKPAPDIYLMAIQEMGVVPEDVVVIEDSQSGAAAAAAAGLAHVITVNDYTRDDAFPRATSIVDSLGDPGIRVHHISGVDARNADGFVDLAGLERVRTSSSAPRA